MARMARLARARCRRCGAQVVFWRIFMFDFSLSI
jgi:hypothetical protein